ncbi:MAG: hypothetical protein GWP08_13765 [Nitrospiraceae bacterium]|nr:hypothetical protein [Nitrospiraceae bacterium]
MRDLTPTRPNPWLRRNLVLAVTVCCMPVACMAQVNENTPGYFAFSIPGLDATPSFTDMSFLNSEPAGALGRVVIHDGHFVDGHGRRLRLLGTNLTFGAAFPAKDQAPLIAGHMRKLGLNAVRFHHMDKAPAPRGIWLPDFSGFDPEQLDRLDWLIYQFKLHGIYTNLNLHVSWSYREKIYEAPQAFRYGKGIDNFYPPYIVLQQEYARALLTHRNPYTSLTYAEDPAVIVVELNNENSLTDKRLEDLRALPEPYLGELTGQWQQWLRKRYTNTEALRMAWEKMYPSSEEASPDSGLPSGWSLDAGNIALPRDSAGLAQRADFQQFLSDTECRYVRDMIRYLKEDLGVKAAVICTQGSYGGLQGFFREGTLSDFIDLHEYWEHPRFPGTPWDADNWYIPNTSMVAAQDGGTLARLAWGRTPDKPFTVSEYDHPAPNDHAAEMFPMLASFAAFQDWDGIYQYNYQSEQGRYENQCISGYFDLYSHPGKLVFLPIAALMYRMRAVDAGIDPILAAIPTGDLALQVVLHGALPSFSNEQLTMALDRPVGHRLTSGTGPFRMPDAESVTGIHVSTTGQIRWDSTVKERASYTVNAPAVRAAVGYIMGRELQLGDMRIHVTKAESGWATVAAGALDGKPLAESSKILVVAVGRVENSNMGWNADRTSVGRHLGTAPTVAEGISAVLRIPGGMKVAALDEAGNPKAEVASTFHDGALEFQIGPEHETLWYAVTPEDD